jgi:diadenosine tetraphosphate (Ap4A) HIT family hydrolase
MADLHERLAADCIELGRFSLCRLLLMNDANYPWFILVPDRDGVEEIWQLDETDRQQLMCESCYLAERLAECFCAEKMNVAALGNVVPQLHVHHVVRHRNDPAWPAPVWGRVPASPYGEAALRHLRQKLRGCLGERVTWEPEPAAPV